jgi:hypothetical protein
LSVVTGNQTYATANQVITGLDIRGCVSVTAPGVVIKNSKITCPSSNSNFALDYNTGSSSSARLTLQDVTISCGVTNGTAVGEKYINVVRANISGCENGFDADSDTTIQDSYIHDLYNSTVGDPHTDGLQSGVGNYIIVTHSVFYGFTTSCSYPNDGSCNGTSAINIFNAASGPAVHDTTLSKNLLAGGAYALYCPRVATSNFELSDNRFSTVYSPHVGEFGPSSDCSNETLVRNVYNETDQPIPLD